MGELDHANVDTSQDLPVAATQVISPEPPPLMAGCPFAHPRQPPLTIAHLLMWMVTSGLFLGLGRVAIKSLATGDWEVPVWYRTLFQVEQVIITPVYGVAVLGPLLMVWRWVRQGPRFPSQPGHWLIVIYGFGIACTWGFGLAVDVLIPAIWDVRLSPYFQSWIHMTLAYLVGGVACSVAAWRLRDRWYWMLDLKVCALLQLSVAAIVLLALAVERLAGGGLLRGIRWEWVVGLRYYQACFFAAVLLAIATYELRRGYYRDWLHWVGVALGLLLPTLALLDALAQRVLAGMQPT